MREEELRVAIEKCWEEEWEEDLIWIEPDKEEASVLVDAWGLKKALYELSTLRQSASLVYDHVTGGRISKPSTDPNEVISVFDDIRQGELNERESEIRHELDPKTAVRGGAAACS